MKWDPSAAIRALLARRRAAAEDRRVAEFCDLMNEEYGGDWYYDMVRRLGS